MVIKVADIKGFTLLEVLIAVAVLSIVLGAIYTTFFLTHRALAGMDQSLVKIQESRALVETLKREIESALYDEEDAYTVFKMDDRDFYGRQASELTVTSFAPVVNGLAKISYHIEEKNDRLSITKTVTPAFQQKPEVNTIELLEDVESFTLEAAYKDQWVKTWDSSLSKTIPEEVKITLTLRTIRNGGEAQSVPPFVLSDTATLRVGRIL